MARRRKPPPPDEPLKDPLTLLRELRQHEAEAAKHLDELERMLLDIYTPTPAAPVDVALEGFLDG